MFYMQSVRLELAYRLVWVRPSPATDILRYGRFFVFSSLYWPLKGFKRQLWIKARKGKLAENYCIKFENILDLTQRSNLAA